MKVPRLSWALLILALGCMVASWGVGIFDPDGVKSVGYRLFQNLWLTLTCASAGVVAGTLLAYAVRKRMLKKLSHEIALAMANSDGPETVKAQMAKDGWIYKETGGDEGEKTWSWSKGGATIILKGTARRMRVGDRVTALVCTDSNRRTLDLLGHGVFAGRFPAPAEWHLDGELQFVRIDLDSGQSVWGPQCWWGSCESVERKHPRPPWTWNQVDVDKFIAGWNEARLKDWQEEQANAKPQAPAEAEPQA